MTFSIDNPRGVATTPLRKICLGKPSGEQGLTWLKATNSEGFKGMCYHLNFDQNCFKSSET